MDGVAVVRFVGRSATSVAQDARHDRCQEPSSSLATQVVPFQSFLQHRHQGRREPFGRENIIEISHVVCLGTHYHKVDRDISSEETFKTADVPGWKHKTRVKFLIMDQWREFWAKVQALWFHNIFFRLFVLWKLFGNVVTERHGARFKIAFEKACSHETQTSKAEVGNLIDFTFEELNRRVGRGGSAPRQSLGGRCDISEWCREIQRDK